MSVVYSFKLAKEVTKLYRTRGQFKCVLSFDCYNAIPAKYKSDLFTSPIKIKAANGTLKETRVNVTSLSKLVQSNLHSLFFV